MTVSSASQVALVVDFDNTLTDSDVGDRVADRFGDPGWRLLEDGHRSGEVPTGALIAYMFSTLRATEAELRAYARQVGVLRPGAAAFLRAAKAVGVDLTIASGGLDVYIDAILGELLSGVRLVSNRLHFPERRFEFPVDAFGCGACGNCKGVVVEAARARGAKLVIAVGDGTSDECLARTADVIIGRDWLLDHARALGRVTHAFDDFADVARVVATLVPGFSDAFERER